MYRYFFKSALKVKKNALIAFIMLFLILFQQSFLVPLKTFAATYPPTTGIQHYIYTFPDGNMYVYDMDNNFSLVYSTTLPGTSAGVRGSVASPTDGMLYISYGSDGGTGASGSLLKYNLLTNSVVWQKTYTYGIDSMAITPDGKTIYMPDGAASSDGIWNIIDTSTGNITGSITGGQSPHNTVVSLDGSSVYLGGLNNNYFRVASTSTNQVVKTIGPLQAGVRPFTINGTNTYAFTNATNFLGFQVLDLVNNKVLYTVSPSGFTGSTSHGISLSPDEKEVYLMDASNSYVHVFDITGLPNSAPKQAADIALTSITGTESPCAYDCHKEGWVLHSHDGKYVFVGDSGDIINTSTRTLLPRDTSSSSTIFSTLANTRKYIEIDWQNGTASFTTSRHGLGYVTTPVPTPTPGGPTPTPTSTPISTPTPTPVPAGTIAQDTFQRTNQSLWGTASDGQTWVGDANTNNVFSINNNTGQVTNTGGTSLNAILGPGIADAQVLFTGSMSAYSSSNIGAVLRWQDTNNWYKSYIDGANLVIQKKVSGSNTTLKTAPFAVTAGTNYSLRFQIVGTTLNAKVWVTGQTEPISWTATVTDSTFSSGRTGLRMLTGGGSATYTSFISTNLSSPTSTPSPTPVPTTTPTPTSLPTPTPTPLPSPTPTATPSPSLTPTPTPSLTISDYAISGSSSADPWGTAFDANGNVWVAVPDCDPGPDCASTTPPGQLQVFNPSTKTWTATYQLPVGYGQPIFLAIDASGNVWFPMFHTNALGMYNPSTSTFQQWTVPTANSGPWDVTVDHNGKIWFTEHYVNQIANFDPVTQKFTEIPTPSSISQPYGITVDASNNIWFTENNDAVALIAEYTNAGQLLEYKIRNTATAGTGLTPHLITIDPSGNIWWSEGWISMIGKLNLAQAVPGTNNGVTEFAYQHLCASCGTHTSGISVDSNGVIWFDDSLQSEFGSFSPNTAQFAVYNTPTTNSHPHDGMNVDKSNNVWFDEEFANKLALAVQSAIPTPTPTSLPTPSPTATPSPTPIPTMTPTPSPVPGIIAQDTFQRPNQTFWGTASDGHSWGSDAATNAVFSIVNNTGQVKNGSTSYNAILGSVATNEQVLFSGSISSFSNSNMGTVLRWNDTNNWYKAYIDGSNLVVQKKVNGSYTTLKTTSFAATGGTNYSLRFQIVGTALSAKVWATNSSEPANWMISVLDNSLTSGYCGLRMLIPGNITANYTSFFAQSL